MTFRRILVLFLVLSLVPVLTFAANAKVKKGADEFSVIGRTVNWKDVKKISKDDMFENRRLKPVMNFKNPVRSKKSAIKKIPLLRSPTP